MREHRPGEPHASQAVSPGASGPGEPGYEGRVTIGDDEDSALGDVNPTGRPGEVPDQEHLDPEVKARLAEVDRLLHSKQPRADEG